MGPNKRLELEDWVLVRDSAKYGVSGHWQLPTKKEGLLYHIERTGRAAQTIFWALAVTIKERRVIIPHVWTLVVGAKT
jgi:hypothetical protein